MLFPSPWLILRWAHKATWRFGSVSDPFCIWDLRDSFASLPSASGWTLSSYSLFWNSKWVTFPRSHGKCMAENKAALFTHITSNVLALRYFMTSPGLQPQHCVCLLAREQERVESSRSLTWTWWEIPSRSVGLFHCFSLCSIKDSTCGRLKERPYLS